MYAIFRTGGYIKHPITDNRCYSHDPPYKYSWNTINVYVITISYIIAKCSQENFHDTLESRKNLDSLTQ